MPHSIRPRSQENIKDLSTLPTGTDSPEVVAPAAYPFLFPPVESDEIGRLGNYRVQRLLGKGGMGFVFQAEDLGLCRPVALKVMNPELGQDVRGWERFLREARVMASIKDDSLVTVFQVGQEQDVVYLAMELLEGVSLEGWLKRVGVPAMPDVLRIGKGIAGGLAVIHRRGLIHRDIKPANLWMEEPAGRVKLLDFGLARFVHDDSTLTQSGAILGTPCFMSPEQARGEPLDNRSDLFSLGCVLYNVCTGTIPFYANNTTAVLTALAIHDPCPAWQLNPAVPKSLSDLVAQLLAKNPQDRPASAEEVIDRLRQIEEGRVQEEPRQTTPSRPRAAVRQEAEPPLTLELRPTATSPAEPGWGRIWMAVALIAALAFAVPLAVSGAFRYGIFGAGHPEKGKTDLVYLAELHPVDRENWPFFPPPKPDGPPVKRGEVRVRGRVSPHGIFMHPPPEHEGTANVTYHLGKEFESFHAEVSQNDGPPESESPFTFAVYGDGRLLWKSRPLSRQADQQTCMVSVRGVANLKIEVQSHGEPRGAHAVWIEPFLSK
jgi:hypothetical protein